MRIPLSAGLAALLLSGAAFAQQPLAFSDAQPEPGAAVHG